MSQKGNFLGPFGNGKYWGAFGFLFGAVIFSSYTHHENRKLNRMIEQQYWSDDESKMHGYFRLKNLERERLMQGDDEYFKLKCLDAYVKKYPFGLDPRRGWRKHTLLYNAKIRGKLPVEWVEGDPWPWQEEEFRARFPEFDVVGGDFGKLRFSSFGLWYYDREIAENPRPRRQSDLSYSDRMNVVGQIVREQPQSGVYPMPEGSAALDYMSP